MDRDELLNEAIYDIVRDLLWAYDGSPTIHTMAPFISLFRAWYCAARQERNRDREGDQAS